MSERKKETSLLPILAGAVALAIALMTVGGYFLSRYINRQMSSSAPHFTPQREDTPIHRVFAAAMYGNSRPVPESEARIAVELPTSGVFEAVTAEFETHDEMDEVLANYRNLFAKETVETRENGPDGKPGAYRFTFKDLPLRFISVKEVDGRPHIRLVWIKEDDQ